MKVLLSTLCILLSLALCSQELNCKVVVDAQQVQTTERGIFQDMETEFAQFMNNTKWTNDTFEEEETINCNLIINISSMPSIGVFEATVQIVSSRPVYGTNYETVLFNFADRDWTFEFVQSQPLNFNENTFTSNITSLLAFYAYVIIGMDYDSFEELGGEPHYEKAWNVVNNAQQSSFTGWQQFNSVRNRYWLVENLRNPQLEGIRNCLYSYHRNGLDILSEQKDEAEGNILSALSEVQKANRARPRSILTVSFMDAKADELTKLFAESSLVRRRQAYNLLNNIDPARSDSYKALIE